MGWTVFFDAHQLGVRLKIDVDVKILLSTSIVLMLNAAAVCENPFSAGWTGARRHHTVQILFSQQVPCQISGRRNSQKKNKHSLL